MTSAELDKDNFTTADTCDFCKHYLFQEIPRRVLLSRDEEQIEDYITQLMAAPPASLCHRIRIPVMPSGRDEGGGESARKIEWASLKCLYWEHY